MTLPSGVSGTGVSAGDCYSLVSGSDGKVYAAGANASGQLGDGSTVQRNLPVAVTLASGVAATMVRANHTHSLAIGSDGQAYAWGSNSYGETTGSATPALLTLPTGVSASAVSGGASFSLVLGSDANIYSWGSSGAGGIVTLATGVGAVAIAGGGYDTALAIGTDGNCYQWGQQSGGRVVSTPRILPLPSGVRAEIVSTSLLEWGIGQFHAVVVGSDGVLYGWGSNSFGQIGNAAQDTAVIPTRIKLWSADSETTLLAGGSTHTLITGRRDGKVYGAGDNATHQLGDGSTIQRTPPVAVALGNGKVAVAASAGNGHSLALASDGIVMAWGANDSGQLGNGGTSTVSTPIQIDLGSGKSALEVSAGGLHSLALGSDGAVYGWGRNSNGQLGDGTTLQRTAPITAQFPAASGIVAVSAGGDHSLALAGDGRLYSWGGNDNGQLGDGGTTQRASPALISLANGVEAAAISGGANFSLAIGSDGRVYGWGQNSHGQLGDGTLTQRTAPVAVTLAIGVKAKAIAAGGGHSLAIGSDGKLYAWGDNAVGQLGDGTQTQRSSPVLVSLPAGVAAVGIAAGSAHSLALGSDGKLYVWGLNASGQLGNGTTSMVIVPAAQSWSNQVVPLVAPGSKLVVGRFHSCAVDTAGEVQCWGENSVGAVGDGTTIDRTVPVRVNGVTGATALAATAAANAMQYSHTCAIVTGGEVRCWGPNVATWLVDPFTNQRLSGVVAVATGDYLSCAVRSDGTGRCLGRDDVTDAIAQLGGITGIATSTYHACAIIQGGVVKCFGVNPLGYGLLNSDGISGAVQVAVGNTHSCALIIDGTVRCWGSNTVGELGDGTTQARTGPVLVAGVSGATSISVGMANACATLANGQVKCWGGGLGVAGSYPTGALRTVARVAAATQVSVGSAHACAKSTGLAGEQIQCWGLNRWGELGDGTLAASLSYGNPNVGVTVQLLPPYKLQRTASVDVNIDYGADANAPKAVFFHGRLPADSPMFAVTASAQADRPSSHVSAAAGTSAQVNVCIVSRSTAKQRQGNTCPAFADAPSPTTASFSVMAATDLDPAAADGLVCGTWATSAKGQASTRLVTGNGGTLSQQDCPDLGLSSGLATSAPTSLNIANTGAGSIVSSDGLTSCTSCTATYTKGSVVTLTAQPAAGETFVGWSGACSGNGSCNVSMAAAANVTAVFVGPPGPPGIGQISAGNASASIGLTAPSSNGGAAISEYSATCVSSNGGGSGYGSNSSSPIVVSGLSNGKTYTCRVAATNSYGVGPVSQQSSSFIPAAPPTAPLLTGLIPIKGGMKLFFGPPADNGGLAITSYVGSCTGGGVTRSASATNSPLVVSGLTTGIRYACSVHASNGLWSTGAESASIAKIARPPGLAAVLMVILGE